jgi:hypothetical protein
VLIKDSLLVAYCGNLPVDKNGRIFFYYNYGASRR